MIRIGMLRFAAAIAILSFPAAASADTSDCHVDTAERDHARTLDWQTFDQEGGYPGTFRELSKDRCFASAFNAYVDWMQNGMGFSNDRERGIGTFHMGQSLAFIGRTNDAVALFNRSFREESLSDPNAAEWNLYVSGVLAFFAEDREAIGAALKELDAIETRAATQWSERLKGLRRCIREPYAQAMSKRCRGN